MKHVTIVKYMFSKKIVENDDLKIENVVVTSNYFKFDIYHGKYKHITQRGRGSDEKYQYFSFCKDNDNEVFCLRITEKFIKDNNLCTFSFCRTDKYDSELLLIIK